MIYISSEHQKKHQYPIQKNLQESDSSIGMMKLNYCLKVNHSEFVRVEMKMKCFVNFREGRQDGDKPEDLPVLYLDDGLTRT